MVTVRDIEEQFKIEDCQLSMFAERVESEKEKKIILDLCGGTGSWSRPYMQAGYDVRNITLPDYDVRTYEPPQNVYGILAAPPCTEFSLAKNGSPIPRNFSEGMKIVEACLQIVWQCQYKGKLKFWALENPVGLLRRFLGRPKYTFSQWQFGELSIKPTDIWGIFNPPRPTVKIRPTGIIKRYSSGKINTFCLTVPKAPNWIDIKGLSRSDLRAITPSGFAEAFFKANK